MDKLYYTISEVSKALGEKPHVIRYWEKTFGSIKPVRTRSGQRRYRSEDFTLLNRIHLMLRDEGYTLEGIKKRLGRRRQIADQLPTLKDIQSDLREAMHILNGEADDPAAPAVPPDSAV